MSLPIVYWNKLKNRNPFKIGKLCKITIKDNRKMIKFDDLIEVIASYQFIYVMNKSYENKGDIDYCSANCGEMCTYADDVNICDRYTGYVVTDINTNPFKGCKGIKNIKDCIYITIQNPKDFDC